MDSRLIGQLGDFELTSTMGVKSLKKSSAYNLGKHNKLSGKPTIQAIGNDLNEISFSLNLHRNIHAIDEILTLLNDMKESGDSFQFIFADGIYQGKYTIEKLDDVITSMVNGQIVRIEIEIKLIENTDASVNAYQYADQRTLEPEEELQFEDEAGLYYTSVAGDRFDTLAYDFYGNAAQTSVIMASNTDLFPFDILLPGTILLIPNAINNTEKLTSTAPWNNED